MCGLSQRYRLAVTDIGWLTERVKTWRLLNESCSVTVSEVRYTDRQTDRERQTERDRQTEIQTGTQTEIETERQTDRDRQAERERQADRERDRQTER